MLHFQSGNARTNRNPLTTNSINTQLQNPEPFINDGSYIYRTAKRLVRTLKSDKVRFTLTMSLVFSIMLVKGSSGEGQATFFGDIIRSSIEETSASISSYIPKSQYQLANLNSISVSEVETQNQGQGGAEVQQVTPEPANVQGASLLSYNPPSTDYIDHNSVKRSQVVEYTVQTGDALSFIASDYGVSVESILWANGLKNSDSISPGQVLRIPPVTGVIHKVKSGETLALIAKKYSVEEAKVIEYNRLPLDGQLQIDDEIILPGGKIVAPVVAAARSKVAVKTSSVPRFSYLPDYGGYFMVPTTGYNWGRIHGRNGIDIANSCGTPIYASADGTVAIADAAGWNGGFGKYIKIVHPNATETLYAHASKLQVSQGQVVGKGQLIASMGTTGRSTGCHLHFEVHGAKNPLSK